MRKWAYLREPYPYQNDLVYKVMLYQTENDGTYVFLYNSRATQISFVDEWHEYLEDALDYWDSFVVPNMWEEIEDPMDGCQHDCFLPIRIKERDIGDPQWGCYEQYTDGSWIEYKE